uniref:Uncharacterized protein n=1 Tax=Lygus hesperus TaxID=30085 RepID=A0A0A9XHV9_LYGHE
MSQHSLSSAVCVVPSHTVSDGAADGVADNSDAVSAVPSDVAGGAGDAVLAPAVLDSAAATAKPTINSSIPFLHERILRSHRDEDYIVQRSRERERVVRVMLESALTMLWCHRPHWSILGTHFIQICKVLQHYYTLESPLDPALHYELDYCAAADSADLSALDGAAPMYIGVSAAEAANDSWAASTPLTRPSGAARIRRTTETRMLRSSHDLHHPAVPVVGDTNTTNNDDGDDDDDDGQFTVSVYAHRRRRTRGIQHHFTPSSSSPSHHPTTSAASRAPLFASPPSASPTPPPTTHPHTQPHLEYIGMLQQQSYFESPPDLNSVCHPLPVLFGTNQHDVLAPPHKSWDDPLGTYTEALLLSTSGAGRVRWDNLPT